MGGDIRRRTSFLALWVGILIRLWERLSEQILHSSAERRRNLSNDLASESKKEGPSFCKGRRLGFWAISSTGNHAWFSEGRSNKRRRDSLGRRIIQCRGQSGIRDAHAAKFRREAKQVAQLGWEAKGRKELVGNHILQWLEEFTGQRTCAHQEWEFVLDAMGVGTVASMWCKPRKLNQAENSYSFFTNLFLGPSNESFRGTKERAQVFNPLSGGIQNAQVWEEGFGFLIEIRLHKQHSRWSLGQEAKSGGKGIELWDEFGEGVQRANSTRIIHIPKVSQLRELIDTPGKKGTRSSHKERGSRGSPWVAPW
jgi:hypothetical protein